mmetsp:Transcript_10576/g.36914  ORF Transcript_10576/g.36914 Transcript_10576/m.36914 type:complete len:252 (-) Transcript_10576:966-1721(-)
MRSSSAMATVSGLVSTAGEMRPERSPEDLLPPSETPLDDRVYRARRGFGRLRAGSSLRELPLPGPAAAPPAPPTTRAARPPPSSGGDDESASTWAGTSMENTVHVSCAVGSADVSSGASSASLSDTAPPIALVSSRQIGSPRPAPRKRVLTSELADCEKGSKRADASRPPRPAPRLRTSTRRKMFAPSAAFASASGRSGIVRSGLTVTSTSTASPAPTCLSALERPLCVSCDRRVASTVTCFGTVSSTCNR